MLIFFLTNLITIVEMYETLKFKHVKTKAYSYAFYVYVSCPPLPTCGLSASFDIAKIKKIIGSFICLK